MDSPGFHGETPNQPVEGHADRLQPQQAEQLVPTNPPAEPLPSHLIGAFNDLILQFQSSLIAGMDSPNVERRYSDEAIQACLATINILQGQIQNMDTDAKYKAELLETNTDELGGIRELLGRSESEMENNSQSMAYDENSRAMTGVDARSPILQNALAHERERNLKLQEATYALQKQLYASLLQSQRCLNLLDNSVKAHRRTHKYHEDLIKANGDMFSANRDVHKINGDLLEANRDLLDANRDLRKQNGDLLTTHREILKANGDLRKQNGDILTAHREMRKLTRNMLRQHGKLHEKFNNLVDDQCALITEHIETLREKNQLQRERTELINTNVVLMAGYHLDAADGSSESSED